MGLIDMFLINLNTEIVACILSFRKSRHKPNLENTTKYGFSPDLGGKNGGVRSMRMQVILDSSFARPGSAPIWGGKKGEFRDWTNANLVPRTFTQARVKVLGTRLSVCVIFWAFLFLLTSSFLYFGGVFQVDETNSAHNETNRNKDSTTRNANLVSATGLHTITDL